MLQKFKNALARLFVTNLPILFVMAVLRVLQYFFVTKSFYYVNNIILNELIGLAVDIWFWLVLYGFSALVFIPLFLFNNNFAKVWQQFVNIIIVVGSAGLLVTFAERLVPFGHELFIRNPADTFSTIAQYSTGGYLPVVIIITSLLVYFVMTNIFNKKINFTFYQPIALCVFFASIISIALISQINNTNQSAVNYIRCNKTTFFVTDAINYFKTNNIDTQSTTDTTNFNSFVPYLKAANINVIDSAFPLMQNNNNNNVLAPYFNFKNKKPNIVIIICESLARAYSGNNATFGSFTPFIDSLAQHSLYWSNCITQATGSFGVLPAIMGALPFAKKGFTNLGKYPEHFSLIKALNQNGYYSYYFHGGSLAFDNYGSFMRMQGTNYLLINFGPDYKIMPSKIPGHKGMGYPDNALFNRSLQVIDSIGVEPYISVYFTLSTHGPYLFDEKPYYDKQFIQHVKKLNLKPEMLPTVNKGADMLTSFLFMDDCVKNFINDYKKHPGYNNTIFIITGDHQSSSVPETSALSHYHVPLIIYSPLLNKSQCFKSVNTHNNIPQTIIGLLKGAGFLNNIPEQNSFIGQQLDTCISFRNIHTQPLVGWNYSVYNMLHKNYMLNNRQVWQLNPGLKLIPVNNSSVLNNLNQILSSYKIIDKYVCQNNKLFKQNNNLNQVTIDNFNTTAEELFLKGSKHLTTIKLKNIANGNIGYILSFDMIIDTNSIDNLPILVSSINEPGSSINFWDKKDVKDMTIDKIITGKWQTFTSQDMYNTGNFSLNQSVLQIRLENISSVPLRLRNIKLEVYFQKQK